MPTTSRIACILVPELAIAEAASAPEKPLSVHEGKGNRARIRYLNGAARTAGVLVGQSLSAARARSADLHSLALDSGALTRRRRSALARLAAHSPRVQPDGPLRFWAEPAPLGQRPIHWCEMVRRALAEFGPVAVGMGSTATLAYAAARHAGDGSHILAPSYEQSFLDAAPLSVLELDGEQLDTLQALGIECIADLRRLDPMELATRFGPALARARRRIDGDDERGPSTPRPEHRHEVSVSLDDEVEQLAALAFLLKPAIEQLLSGLRAAGLGSLQTDLILKLRGGRVHPIRLRTAEPISDDGALLELLRNALERTDLQAPVHGLCLRASETGDSRRQGRDLFGSEGRDPAAREVVLERMRSRFGQRAVRRATRIEVGPPIARAQWLSSGPAVPGPASPWRRVEPPSCLLRGQVQLAGRLRKVLHMGRVERANLPWWLNGNFQVERYAWAELEGPMLVLLRADEEDWQAVAWMD